jgi:hypothetical protein
LKTIPEEREVMRWKDLFGLVKETAVGWSERQTFQLCAALALLFGAEFTKNFANKYGKPMHGQVRHSSRWVSASAMKTACFLRTAYRFLPNFRLSNHRIFDHRNWPCGVLPRKIMIPSNSAIPKHMNQ